MRLVGLGFEDDFELSVLLHEPFDLGFQELVFFFHTLDPELEFENFFIFQLHFSVELDALLAKPAELFFHALNAFILLIVLLHIVTLLLQLLQVPFDLIHV